MKVEKNGTLELFLKQYILNLPTLLAAAILGILMIYSSEIRSFTGGFDILGGLQSAYILGLAAYLVPVIVCFPYTMRFSEEYRSGYRIYNELRVGRKRYIFYRLRDALISSGTVMLAGIAIYTVYACCYCKIHGLECLCSGDGFFGNRNSTPMYYEWIENGLGVLVYLVNILFLMAYGMFWSVVGTVISVFVTNRRAAVAAPFLFKRFLDYVIPESMFFLMPSNLRLSTWVAAQPVGGIWYGILYIAITFILGWMIIYVKYSVDAIR